MVQEKAVFGLSLAVANRIIAFAFEKASELDLKPIGAAILDPGGHLVAFQRQDKASILRFEIAFGKAYAALAVGVGSRAVARMAVEKPNLALGLSGVSGGKIVPLPGGVLIFRNRELIGAVGVTGDTSDNDELCAVSGVEGVGLEARCE